MQTSAHLPQSPPLLPARDSGFPWAEGFHLGWTKELDPRIPQGEKLPLPSTIHIHTYIHVYIHTYIHTQGRPTDSPK